jgi:hypothetical protein
VLDVRVDSLTHNVRLTEVVFHGVATISIFSTATVRQCRVGGAWDGEQVNGVQAAMGPPAPTCQPILGLPKAPLLNPLASRIAPLMDAIRRQLQGQEVNTNQRSRHQTSVSLAGFAGNGTREPN